MRAAVSAVAGDWIVEFVNRPRVQCDAQIQAGPQSFLLPFGFRSQIGQLERKFSRKIDVRKNEVETVAPGVFRDDGVAKSVAQTRNGSEKVFHEQWDFRFGQLAEP